MTPNIKNYQNPFRKHIKQPFEIQKYPTNFSRLQIVN